MSQPDNKHTPAATSTTATHGAQSIPPVKVLIDHASSCVEFRDELITRVCNAFSNIVLDEFDDDTVAEWFADEHLSSADAKRIERSYELIAAGRIEEAMEELRLILPDLTPPRTQLAIADLLSKPEKVSA